MNHILYSKKASSVRTPTSPLTSLCLFVCCCSDENVSAIFARMQFTTQILSHLCGAQSTVLVLTSTAQRLTLNSPPHSFLCVYSSAAGLKHCCLCVLAKKNFHLLIGLITSFHFPAKISLLNTLCPQSE